MNDLSWNLSVQFLESKRVKSNECQVCRGSDRQIKRVRDATFSLREQDYSLQPPRSADLQRSPPAFKDLPATLTSDSYIFVERVLLLLLLVYI